MEAIIKAWMFWLQTGHGTGHPSLQSFLLQVSQVFIRLTFKLDPSSIQSCFPFLPFRGIDPSQISCPPNTISASSSREYSLEQRVKYVFGLWIPSQGPKGLQTSFYYSLWRFCPISFKLFQKFPPPIVLYFYLLSKIIANVIDFFIRAIPQPWPSASAILIHFILLFLSPQTPTTLSPTPAAVTDSSPSSCRLSSQAHS